MYVYIYIYIYLCIIAKGHPNQLHRVLNNTEVKERNIYLYISSIYDPKEEHNFVS